MLNPLTNNVHTINLFNDLNDRKTKLCSSGLKTILNKFVLLQERIVLVFWLIIYYMKIVLMHILFRFYFIYPKSFFFLFNAITVLYFFYNTVINLHYFQEIPRFYFSKWSTLFHCFRITRLKTTRIYVQVEMQHHALIFILFVLSLKTSTN